MKKLCLLLAVVFVLAGCGKQPEAQPTQAAETGNPWVSFDIYAINDLHGKLVDTDAQPGLDELSTYLKQGSGNTLLLATGDMWQGASESNLTGGKIITQWMNGLDFTAMTMGGHEYDWKEAGIRENQQLAQFPFLGINIYNRETDQQVDYCQSSVLVDQDGVQIGIIGAIGNCYYSIASQNVQDVYFKTGAELTELVRQEARKLRNEGADFIIYMLHDGHDVTMPGTKPLAVSDDELEGYYDPSLSEDVDLVFEADTHYWYVLQDGRGVYHLQAGGNNSGISHAKVLIHKKTGESSVVSAELIPSSKYQHLEKDPLVEKLLEQYADQIAPASRILGVNDRYRSGAQLCQLVAQLYCEKGAEKWGAQYDIVLGGGYLSCRSPGYLPEGEVTYSQLQSLLPFDNEITLCTIGGQDLLDKFLQTSHSAYYIETTPYGERIRSSIDPDGTYYVVTDRYTADYAPNRMTVVESYGENIFARDLLADYFGNS